MAQHQKGNFSKFNRIRKHRSDRALISQNNRGLVISKSNSGEQPADQGSECWGDLWDHIKTKADQVFRRNKHRLK